MSVKRLVAAAAAGGLLVALGACGGGGDEPVAEGSPTVEGASSASPSETDEQSGGYDADELVAAMMAAVADKQTAHLTMVMGGIQGMRAEGDMSLAGGTNAMQMTVEAPQLGGTMEVRLVDGVMYLSIPPMTPKGKFIKADPDDPNSPFGGLGSITEGDPLSTFESFEAGLQDVKYVGAETLDGEDVDHYVLTVDTQKAAKAQGESAPPGPKTVTYDLWIDGDDLMRRMEFGSGASGMVMSMSDWGKPVTVEAPPASAIMKMPQMPS